MKLFSIIIPVYNKASYIEHTMRSVMSQSYGNWECVVVDDGSTDNSKEIIEGVAAREPRIKTIFKSNSGVADTRNIGLKAAVGHYVIFLDGDDLINSQKLSLTLDKFEKHPDADVIYSDYNFVSNEGQICGRKLRIKLNTKNVYLDLLTHWDEDLIVPIHCCCYQRDFLVRHGVEFDVSLNNKEDWDFLLQAARHSNAFHFIEQPLVSYLLLEQSRSNIHNSSMLEGTNQLYLKHYNEQHPQTLRAIAYNLRYRIIRNHLIKILGKKEPSIKLSDFSIANRTKIKSLSRRMIPRAITRSIFKLLKKI